MPMPDGTPMNEYRARRDYFIGQALAGLCAHYGVKQDASDMAQAAVVLAIETIKMIKAIGEPK
jgi:hypothetical protein